MGYQAVNEGREPETMKKTMRRRRRCRNRPRWSARRNVQTGSGYYPV